MLVLGGRSRWTRVVSVAGVAGVLGFRSTAGCGSRTSMLDPDLYGYDFAGDGNSDVPLPIGNAGTKATGGTGTVSGGRGGRPSQPMPATGGKGGSVNPGLAVAPCERYCPGYSTDCAE